MKTLTLLLLSASMLRAQCAGCSSVGGGGGASATYQLTDFKVTLSGNTLTIGAGCAVSTPCRSPLAGGAAITTSATAAAPVGNGTALILLTNTGTYDVGLPASGLTVTCTGCTPRVGTTSLPNNTLLLWTWAAVSSVWNSSGTDNRSFLSFPQKQFVPGSVFAEDATTITIPSGSSSVSSKAIAFCSKDVTGGNYFVSSGISTNASPAGDPCQLIFLNTGSSGLSSSYLKIHYPLPSTWSGTITLELIWSQGGDNSAGNVQWNLASVCFNVGLAMTSTPTYNTGTPVVVARPLTAIPASASFTVPVTGCTAGSYLDILIQPSLNTFGGTTYPGSVTGVAATLSAVF